MKSLNFRFALLLLLTAIGNSISAAPSAGDPNAKSYAAQGVVEQIAPDRSTVTIHHQNIPGYMMEMTMDFPVQSTNELNGISPGDKITFTLVVTEKDDWVENIHRTGRAAETTTNAMPMLHMMNSELKPGDVLPDYELTAEDGRQIHFADFRGKVLAFTFFYTRCPLPDYCPLMSNNFHETRKLLLAMTDAPTNWQFLSISFDPDFDTPEVLSNYGGVYRGDDADRWLFASASAKTLANLAPNLDLMIMRDERKHHGTRFADRCSRRARAHFPSIGRQQVEAARTCRRNPRSRTPAATGRATMKSRLCPHAKKDSGDSRQGGGDEESR